MSIEILPQNIAEKIAAGEVVERPCSVVKELVENSIDASATSITVEIENGGTTYIRVTDNGTGMNPEDAEKAFLRHATSKIKDEENLFAISTMGFRGEALYAIGAVSLIELRTKEHDAEAGIHLSMEGGVKSDVFSAAVSDGTSIVVKNLFYNTPARMKFLKTNRTEGAYIEDFVERIALAHTDIAFKLISDGSQKLITGGNGNLNQAVHAIYGADYSKNITDVNYSSDNMKISGVLGNSSVFRSNRNFQTFFVNGRYVKSPLVSNAVEEAHKSHIMVGKHPFFVLNLELPYSEVDINVHPAKTQVKFTNESLVYKTIYWAIKNTLESDYNSANFKQTRHVPQMPDVFPAAKQTGFSFAQKGFSSNGVQAPMPTAPDYGGPVPTVHTKEHTSTAVMEKPAETIVTEESPETIPEYIIIGQAFNTYIVIEIEDVLIYIDQHAAHERKIYEELLKQDTISSQMLISGVNIALTKTEMASVLGNMPVLEKLGFEIDPFGENVIMVRSTPIELPTPELKDTILEIVGKIDDNYQDLTSDARENAVHTLACKAAVKGNKKLHPEEIRPLVEWVLEQNNNQTCPHGRPLTYKISKRELDKLFKRIV